MAQYTAAGEPTPTNPSQEEADFEAIRPTSMSKLAGGVLLGVSVFELIVGAQAWSLVVRFDAVLVFFLVVLLGLGAWGAFCGFKVTRLRGWAALAGSITGGFMAVVLLSWFVFALSHGVAALLALLLVPASIMATILSALTIGAGRRADEARARLRGAGLEAGR